jgi:hypothetical protein
LPYIVVIVAAAAVNFTGSPDTTATKGCWRDGLIDLWNDGKDALK